MLKRYTSKPKHSQERNINAAKQKHQHPLDLQHHQYGMQPAELHTHPIDQKELD